MKAVEVPLVAPSESTRELQNIKLCRIVKIEHHTNLTILVNPGRIEAMVYYANNVVDPWRDVVFWLSGLRLGRGWDRGPPHD